MTIEKIEDVIVPNKIIGIDTDWESEILPIIETYADYLGDEMSEGTSADRIKHCELTLCTTLPNDLKLFYLRFGAARLISQNGCIADVAACVGIVGWV